MATLATHFPATLAGVKIGTIVAVGRVCSMRLAEPNEARGVQVAAFTSMLLIAQQVAGKAARDALFLSSFHASFLPYAMAAGAVLSLVAVYGLSRWMARSTPATIMPVLFSLSAVGFGCAWVVAHSAPRSGALLVYLQTALLSPVMISTFWSLINERFDPHTAKRAVARISGGGTLGGVLGGLAVWRASTWIQPVTVLLLLAVINVLAVIGSLLTRARRSVAEVKADGTLAGEEPSALRVLQRAPFLRNLALLVASGSAISSLLDYLLSAEAAAALGKGQPLLSFFALFWLGVAILSFILQVALGRVALEKLSLAINIAILPGIIVLGGALGLAVPGLASTAMLRGAEAVQRNTLFRSAYELLYTPVPEASKRVAKAVIDVGFDRLGTIVGSVIALAVLGAASRAPEALLLTAVVALALVTLPLARRLHVGYVAALQEGLREAAARVEDNAPEGDRMSLGAESHRPERLERDHLIEQIEALQPGGISALVERRSERDSEELAPQRALSALQSPHAMLDRARDLLSGSDSKIERALPGLDSRGPGVACAILLLADPAHQDKALTALREIAPTIAGQLLDALLDPTMDFRVRRKLPRALEGSATQRAADGLLLATTDERFEVRYACAQALSKITEQNSSLVIPRERVFEAIRLEVESGKRIVEGAGEEGDADTEPLDPFVAGLLQDRVDRSLEHVFRLLSLVLEREPLRIAFRALYHEDTKYRGTALEYLDAVLPAEIRDVLWPYLGETAPLPAARPTHELLAELAALGQ